MRLQLRVAPLVGLPPQPIGPIGLIGPIGQISSLKRKKKGARRLPLRRYSHEEDPYCN